MHQVARDHLVSVFPELGSYIGLVPVLELRSRSDISPIEAMSDVIIGQMLSRDAARAIRFRAKESAKRRGVELVAELALEELREAGLSSGKAKAINRLFAKYGTDDQLMESLPSLEYEALRSEVCSNWGLGGWTAAILALFYFGKPDVFPSGDGSIQRALQQLELRGLTIDPDLARPYRSYLALYLWAILDNGYLD